MQTAGTRTETGDYRARPGEARRAASWAADRCPGAAETPDALRIEVSDTRTERVPLLSAQELPGNAESGRGLLLVARQATRWGAVPRPGAPGKTVWAEYALAD